MAYRDPLDALRLRHDALKAELVDVHRERERLAASAERATALEREVADLRRRMDDLLLERGQSLLDDVAIASPCSARWEDMEGDERMRFCGRCSLHVYNVSAMTRQEAETLLVEARGERRCLRMHRRSDGTILTADCPVGQRRRRVTRLAAAALAVGGSAAALVPAPEPQQASTLSVPRPVVLPTVEVEGELPEPEPRDPKQPLVMGW